MYVIDLIYQLDAIFLHLYPLYKVLLDRDSESK